MSQCRERMQFTGRVQGVFFRATSAEIARDRPLTGFVRNLDDGSVEMEVQGESGEVDSFLRALQERYSKNIRDCNRRRIGVVAGESGFDIRY